jgi:Asp-tRNA(Asn)/Glu-tRNA(Gln) amidotransferase A subunit family amidase
VELATLKQIDAAMGRNGYSDGVYEELLPYAVAWFPHLHALRERSLPELPSWPDAGRFERRQATGGSAQAPVAGGQGPAITHRSHPTGLRSSGDSSNAGIRALSLVAVREAIASGELTSEAAVNAAIEQADRFGSELNLFITYEPEAAREAARASDIRRARGEPLGPLHGVPITLKDGIDTAGLRTTNGSRIFADRVPAADAPVAALVKRAGAIVIGKTNMHEFGQGATSTNPHYGAVRNPWSVDRIPGGSSGGAAACVAMHVGHAALGTDGGGSARMPAHFCGVVGMLPTGGMVSQAGVSAGEAAPIARCVEDVALMYSVIAGDERAALVLPERLAGLRVGVSERYFWGDLDSDVEDVTRSALRATAAAGAKLVPLSFQTLDLVLPVRATAMADGYVAHQPYLQRFTVMMCVTTFSSVGTFWRKTTSRVSRRAV